MSFPMPTPPDKNAPPMPPEGKPGLKPFPKGMPSKREAGKDKKPARKKSMRMFGTRKK